jgi:DNA-binding NarL/FixJ family response regulator
MPERGDQDRPPEGAEGAFRLLLTDDDPHFLAILVVYLGQDPRFEIVGCANDGREAVELVRALRPDVVLMDIDMPVMDGVEASRRIREEQPALPIVLVSASQFVDRVARARAAGATGYVQKGGIDTDLLEAVLAAAEGRLSDSAAQLHEGLTQRQVRTRGV